MSNDINDFGFTTATEAEMIDKYKPDDPPLDGRAYEMLDAITPLLENLKKNPEREYIHWPDRVDKITAFQKKLNDILGE